MKTSSSTTNETEALLAAVVKNLEKRWGLTLASFLPLSAHGSILQLQREVTNSLLQTPRHACDKVASTLSFMNLSISIART